MPPPGSAAPERVDVEVVVPLRWSEPAPERVREMGEYLAELLAVTPYVTVVDGSPPPQARDHRRCWPPAVRIVEPEPPGAWYDGADREAVVAGTANGKVLGSMTGIRAARTDAVLLCDDDVRLTPDDVRVLTHRLADADAVRPVTVFDRWPWHAVWDGGRTLLAAAVAADWPGMLALRRGAVVAAGGWSPGVIFENLELWRTLQARGARLRLAGDVVVRRRPPEARHFLTQRVRQAYDDLAQPGRLVAELAVLPLVLLLARRGPAALALATAGVVVVAEVGRRRLGGAVPAPVSLAAPLWLLERGVVVWVVLVVRARGGVRYHGRRFRTAAHSVRALAPRPDPR